jgi:uncharacterized membrane-anchored protein YjiN (DUF445 family)
VSGNASKKYERLDHELLKEIIDCVADRLREEEAVARKVRHDKKRANVKLILRKYREIVKYVDNAVYEASRLDYDITLQDLLEMMSGDRRETFRVESIKESAATAKVMVDHIDRMLEIYKVACENSVRDEDKRRYRILHDMYISQSGKDPDQIAKDENVNKSTVYRDIDAAADRLSVLLFGVYGLKFL